MESSSFQLDAKTIENNIKNLQQLLKEKNADYCYISSFDPFLNEYVPLEDCHRYYFTGFTGSTAEVLVPAEGKVQLFVDGRYHEQAPKEVDESLVEVVKAETAAATALKNSLKGEMIVAYEAIRTPLALSNHFKEKVQSTVVIDDELNKAVQFNTRSGLPAIHSIEPKVQITSVKDKLSRVFQDFGESTGIFLSALDDIAWITNCRGYQLPYLSSFYGRALVTRNVIYVFVDQDILIEDQLASHSSIKFILDNDFASAIKNLGLNLDKIYYDSKLLNAADFTILHDTFGSQIEERAGGLTPYKSIKDESEKELIRQSFINSSRAIADTINWVREQFKLGHEISELDVFNQTSAFYKKNGAVTQSFHTISGVGPNSSIIHFGSPSADIKVKDNDVILLDSGGYYDSGFATDKTRTFLATKEGAADPKLIEIFTLVMKGLLNAQSAVVPIGTSGKIIDEIARHPIKEGGYNYNHGTGHGVGIYVHEAGAGLTGAKDIPLLPGQVVSIEPGIYIPGFGGVRHENVVIVQKHPEKADHVFFEPLVFIEFDETLIDRSLFTKEEEALFDEYQELCREKGMTLN